MLIWIEFVNVPYFFMFPKEWVNPPETLAVKQSFSAPPYLSKDIHTVFLFLLFLLFFPFLPPFCFPFCRLHLMKVQVVREEEKDLSN